jgi:predicted hydrocarbon binding protein
MVHALAGKSKLSKKQSGKKAAAKAKTKRQARGKKPSKYVQVQAPSEGYEEMLLNQVLSHKNCNTSEYSMIFNSVLSSLTPNSRRHFYNSGLSVGRLLYRLEDRQKRYKWYEESIKDLVSFLERAGFLGITYHIFPDKIDIRFNNRNKTHIGSNVHLFESGLISGFITAASQQHVAFNEVACSNNGSDSCHFVSSKTFSPMESNGSNMLERVIAGVGQNLKENSKGDSFSDEYACLASSMLLDDEYSVQMAKIMMHIGFEISNVLGFDLSKNAHHDLMQRIFRLLNICEIVIKSQKPLKLEMHFGVLKAKKEFVDISIAFLNGFLEGSMKQNSKINARTLRRGNSYIVTIT